MKLKNKLLGVVRLAKISMPFIALIIGLDFLGISTAQFVIYSLSVLTYFGLCSAFWIAYFLKGVDDRSAMYYIVILATLPFVILVKTCSALGLFDLIKEKLDSQAQRMGLPSSDGLLDHIETQTEVSRE